MDSPTRWRVVLPYSPFLLKVDLPERVMRCSSGGVGKQRRLALAAILIPPCLQRIIAFVYVEEVVFSIMSCVHACVFRHGTTFVGVNRSLIHYYHHRPFTNAILNV